MGRNLKGQGKMSIVQKNTWSAKAVRTCTSMMPVSGSRKGSCKRCGMCCKLPAPCPFLRYNEAGESCCGIYGVRPPVCRKYPRTKPELITADTCGFSFG